MDGPRLMVGLVHNADGRLLGARAVQERLIESLSRGGCSIEVIEEEWKQRLVRPVGVLLAALRSFGDLVLTARWERYLGRRRSLNALTRASWRAIVPLLNRGSDQVRRRKRVRIEGFVTQKHLALWERFIENEVQWLIVLEDDVVWKQDSESGIQQLVTEMRSAMSGDRSRPLAYFDIAGGFNLNVLGLEAALASQVGRTYYFNRPVTNTAAGYVLSQELARVLLRGIHRRPWLRRIGIDFLLNHRFMALRNRSISCVHFGPPVLGHGSFGGEHTSWEIDLKSRDTESKPSGSNDAAVFGEEA